MPVLVTISYPSNASSAQDAARVSALLKNVAELVAHDLGEALDNVRVTVKELPPDHYSVGGVLYSDKAD